MEKEFQRWTAKRKVELLLHLIRGETQLVDACREHDLKQSEVEAWMETFLQGGERSLKARSEDEQAVHEPTEHPLGDRHDTPLLWPRRLVPSDGDHRLLRPDDRRVAIVAIRHRTSRRRPSRTHCASGTSPRATRR